MEPNQNDSKRGLDESTQIYRQKSRVSAVDASTKNENHRKLVLKSGLLSLERWALVLATVLAAVLATVLATVLGLKKIFEIYRSIMLFGILNIVIRSVLSVCLLASIVQVF